MSYCLHITRKENWYDDDRPIAREEWVRVAAADAELEPYEEMQADEDDPVYRLDRPGLDVAFSHDEDTGNIDVSCGYFEDVLPKVLEIAARLGAVVQGDDGEYYRMTESGREMTDVRPDPATGGIGHSIL